ncbi:MAG TPA: N-6 DNA methylase, partial [Ktedonobacteraceae bacterium]|nr:N-6 DNA methylase [Ktedonobacteraceae bacterium]
ACGSGNFLARAALRLGQALAARGLSQEEICSCVRANIWGLDPDPVACFLAEMQVRAPLETICGSIDNSLSPHIHQADSLALAWQPCVDLLVANPPYLAAKNIDLSHYSQARRRGQADSYLLFLELALRAVRPGGWIGLVLPDPVLARANAGPERASLLRECTIQHLWHLSGVFAAEVGALVIVAQKTPPRLLHRVNWTRARWRPALALSTSAAESQQIEQELLVGQPGAELRYLLGSQQGRVSERLRLALHEAGTQVPSNETRLLPLDSLVDIKRGEELGRSSELLKPLATCRQGLPVLRGGIDLRPYATSSSDLGIELADLKKPVERYQRPKLLVVKSTEHLQAALDTRGHVVLQTLYLLQLRSSISNSPDASSASQGEESRGAGDSRPLTGFGVSPTSPSFEGMGGEESRETYYFLLALLNSRLLGGYVYHLHTAYKLVQPQIEQAVLARLPIAWGTASERREIADRARALAQTCSEADPVVEWGQDLLLLYEEQERAVRALYAAAISGIFAGKGALLDG